MAALADIENGIPTPSHMTQVSLKKIQTNITASVNLWNSLWKTGEISEMKKIDSQLVQGVYNVNVL